MAHQGQSLLELVLDLLSETVGVGGQLQVVLGVALLCKTGGWGRKKKHMVLC